MASAHSNSLISVRNLGKTYRRGSEEIHVLQGLNLDVDAGDFVAFMGPSGSGKTTLLNLDGRAGCAAHGSIRVAGDEITIMSAGKLNFVARAARGICVSDVQFNSGADGVSKRGAAVAADAL